jgi:hypothetical protein
MRQGNQHRRPPGTQRRRRPRATFADNPGRDDKPCLISLPPFIPHPSSKKPVALEAFMLEHLPSMSYCRFDYSGHGASNGTFASTHLGTWVEDAVGILDEVCDPDEKQIVVGELSAGAVGWLCLLDWLSAWSATWQNQV